MNGTLTGEGRSRPANPANIFSQVAGETPLGTMIRMKGIVLCATKIAMNANAKLLWFVDRAQGCWAADAAPVGAAATTPDPTRRC
jgi:hypothetical protein